MPDYQIALTVWIAADDEDQAANLLDARVPVAYRIERIQVRDDVRSLMQGFAAARKPGCPYGSPPGCRCANCYQPGKP
jgi:hypothetical protein